MVNIEVANERGKEVSLRNKDTHTDLSVLKVCLGSKAEIPDGEMSRKFANGGEQGTWTFIDSVS